MARDTWLRLHSFCPVLALCEVHPTLGGAVLCCWCTCHHILQVCLCSELLRPDGFCTGLYAFYHDMSAESVRLPAELTMREAVEFQYPLLNEPSKPARPLSNAQSAAPQTYTEILPWELSEAARELVNALDNTQRLYYKPPCHAQREGTFEAEVDIRGRVVRVMDTVNAALKQQGSAVRCHGGGEGRSMSFADLVMRLDNMEEDNNLKDLSGRVLGIVLVRKNLGLKQGESLEEALKDPQRGGPIKAAVQEVRADEKSWHLMFQCVIATATYYCCQGRLALQLPQGLG